MEARTIDVRTEAPQDLEHERAGVDWERGDRPPGRPPFSLGAALAAGWPLIALCALVLVAAAVFVGIKRDPVYTAEAQLTVGNLAGSAQSVPGYVLASEDLAETYGRVATTDVIVQPLARRLRLPVEPLDEAVTASPIPEQPVILLEARAAERATAVTVANGLAAEIDRWEQRQTGQDQQASQTLKDFRRWSRIAVALESRLEVRRALRRQNPALMPRQRIQETRAAAEVARVRADGSRARYQTLLERDPRSSGLQVTARAREATSDRAVVTQQLGVIGLLGGAILGAGLAVLRARRRPLRP